MKIIFQTSLFLLAFALVFISPKPDLRIEKIRHRLALKSEVIIVGNSILEHQSPCTHNRISIANLYENASVVGEGGLLLEEAYLSLIDASKPKRKLIIISAPYQYSQPLYYPFQNHAYYSYELIKMQEIKDYPWFKKNLWRLDEFIAIGDKKLNRSDASLKIKNLASKDRCGYEIPDSKKLLNSIFSHSSNNFINQNIQFELLEKLSNKYDISIIIVPVYLSEKNVYPETIMAANNQLADIQSKLNHLKIHSIILEVQNNIENYDEPWCMCGHLSRSGRVILESAIKNIQNTN